MLKILLNVMPVFALNPTWLDVRALIASTL